MWEGVNAHVGTVASAIWVNRLGWPQAIGFIDIDGTSCVDVVREPVALAGAPASALQGGRR